jgi:hypothetical protein
MLKYKALGIWIDGTWVPIVSGGADDGDDDGADDDTDDGDDETDDDEKPPPKAKGRQFGEDRVEAIVKKRVGQAQRRARQDMAKELGFDSVDDMKAAFQKVKDGSSEEEKDLAKERERNQATKAENERQKAEVAQERLNLKVERRLLAKGADPKRAEGAVRLIGLNVDDEPDADDIKEAVETFQEEWPELFSGDGGGGDDEDETPPKSRVPGSDPGRQPKSKPKGSAAERASNRLAERHPELAKG